MGVLNKRLWWAVRAAIRLSAGIYWNDSFEPSYQDLSLHSYDVYQNSHDESFVIAHVKGSIDGADYLSHAEDYCMVAFRGREYDTNDYNACCDDWWDTDCWDTTTKSCWNAIVGDMEDDAKSIRDSSFTTNAWNGNGDKCKNLNDELAQNFEMSNDHKSEIENCMDTCVQSDGSKCRLYFTGHSQGGVYAQMAAIKFYTYVQTNNINMYVLTFGTPPMYPRSTTTPCEYLPDDDHMISFVTYGSVDGDTCVDAAVSIGLEEEEFAAHSSTGNLVLLNAQHESVYVTPTYDFDSTTYGTAQYNFNYYDDVDNKRLELHEVSKYKTRIEEIVETIIKSSTVNGGDNDVYYNAPNENGFTSSWCKKDEQCATGLSCTNDGNGSCA